MTKQPSKRVQELTRLLAIYAYIDEAIDLCLADLDHTRFEWWGGDLEECGFNHACGTFYCLGGRTILLMYGARTPGGVWAEADRLIYELDALGGDTQFFDICPHADEEGNEAIKAELLRRRHILHELQRQLAIELHAEI